MGGESIVGMGESYGKSVLGIGEKVLGIGETVLGTRGGRPLGKYQGTHVRTASCYTAAAGEKCAPKIVTLLFLIMPLSEYFFC
eukprot:13573439-Ditylum_brightwellii.AAC.1